MPSAWVQHVQSVYRKKKAKNASYTYGQAMKDAKSSYKRVAATKSKKSKKSKKEEEEPEEEQDEKEEKPKKRKRKKKSQGKRRLRGRRGLPSRWAGAMNNQRLLINTRQRRTPWFDCDQASPNRRK